MPPVEGYEPNVY